MLLYDLRLDRGPLAERNDQEAVHALDFVQAPPLTNSEVETEMLLTGGSDCILRILDISSGSVDELLTTQGSAQCVNPILCAQASKTEHTHGRTKR